MQSHALEQDEACCEGAREGGGLLSSPCSARLLGYARLTAHMFLYCLPPFGQHDDPVRPSKTRPGCRRLPRGATPAIEHTATSALAFMSRLSSPLRLSLGRGSLRKLNVIISPDSRCTRSPAPACHGPRAPKSHPRGWLRAREPPQGRLPAPAGGGSATPESPAALQALLGGEVRVPSNAPVGLFLSSSDSAHDQWARHCSPSAGAACRLARRVARMRARPRWRRPGARNGTSARPRQGQNAMARHRRAASSCFPFQSPARRRIRLERHVQRRGASQSRRRKRRSAMSRPQTKRSERRAAPDFRLYHNRLYARARDPGACEARCSITCVVGACDRQGSAAIASSAASRPPR